MAIPVNVKGGNAYRAHAASAVPVGVAGRGDHRHRCRGRDVALLVGVSDACKQRTAAVSPDFVDIREDTMTCGATSPSGRKGCEKSGNRGRKTSKDDGANIIVLKSRG